MADSDAQLVEAAREGDPTAMSQLLERHAPAITRFSMKMCGQRQDAEDVVQETLAAAIQGLSSFRGDAALSTWLFTIARSFCIKKRRTSKFAPRQVLSLDADGPAELAEPSALPDEAAARREALHAVDLALERLPPDQREVLLLRDVEGPARAKSKLSQRRLLVALAMMSWMF